jgi:NADH-quinone oxidoreductase subunit J
MLGDILSFVFLGSTVFFALLTVELKNMFQAIICLCGLCINVGALFWILNAPYVSVFQWLIYAGAIIVLFLATVMLTQGDLKNENQLD